MRRTLPSGNGGTLGVTTAQPLQRTINPSVEILAFMLLVIADFVGLPFPAGRRELFHDPGEDRHGLKKGEECRPHGVRL